MSDVSVVSYSLVINVQRTWLRRSSKASSFICKSSSTSTRLLRASTTYCESKLCFWITTSMCWRCSESARLYLCCFRRTVPMLLIRVASRLKFPPIDAACKSTHRCESVLLFLLNYWLRHPENYLFLLCIKIFSGSMYPKTILFNFEIRSAGLNVPRSYRRESVPGDHYMCKTIYFDFTNLPCPHQIEFDRHFFAAVWQETWLCLNLFLWCWRWRMMTWEPVA